jgi:hypothetical protein
MRTHKMEKQKLLTFGLMAILVICIVLISGCVKEKSETLTPTPTPSVTPTPTATLTPAPASFKTCTELNGYVCEVGEECQGEWLDASDTFSCCSEKCKSSISEEELLTIDLFEVNPENEELGDVT